MNNMALEDIPLTKLQKLVSALKASSAEFEKSAENTVKVVKSAETKIERSAESHIVSAEKRLVSAENSLKHMQASADFLNKVRSLRLEKETYEETLKRLLNW